MKIPACLSLLCRAEQGAALVELAIVTPFLMLFLVGAVDVGRVYFFSLEVANAAHAGAEYGSQFPTNSAGITAAAQASAPDVGLLAPVVSWGSECSDGSSYTASSTTPSPACVASANRGTNTVYRVTVTTSAVYKPLIPWPAIPYPFNVSGPATITLSSTATIRAHP
ncbi:MAG: TadE/TadG family type IV pilus assembly protein [Terracidiphilus sp.]